MPRLPTATLALAGALLAAYGLEVAGGGMSVCHELGFTSAAPSLATAFASMWLHDPDHLVHLVGNVLALLTLGAVGEREVGGWRLATLFIAAGFGGAAMHWLVNPAATTPMVGCSGSICGLMAVAAVARPRAILGFAVPFVGMNIAGLFGVTGLVSSEVSLGAHVGGFCVGTLFALDGRMRGLRWAAQRDDVRSFRLSENEGRADGCAVRGDGP